MKKKIAIIIVILTILGMTSQLFANTKFPIEFPHNQDYPNMYNVPDNVFGGADHNKIKKFYNQFMNKNGEVKGYLYDIALPDNGTGKVILMPGMGKEGEISTFMLSTSEAMGYAMIMAVIMNDKETFEGLWKTCQYYEAYNPDTDSFNKNLTSWSIPGKVGTFKDVDPDVDGEYHLPQPLDINDKNVLGPSQTIAGHKKTKEECRWSATDGDQDIAYALLMAHWQWEIHAPETGNDAPYLGAALARYREISEKIIVKVDGTKDLMHLRTGDYFGKYNHSEENHTRPCDWTFTHYRTAFENIGDDRYRDLNHSLYDYILGDHPLAKKKLKPDFAWMDFNTGKLREAKNNSSENPEYMPEPKKDSKGYYWDKNDFDEETWKSYQKWKPAGVLSDVYNWNACRYPWRVGLDAIHYQDHRSIKETIKVADALYEKYGSIVGKDGTSIAHNIHELPMGTTLNTDSYLKEYKKIDPNETELEKIRYEKKDAIWTSPAFTAPYLFAYAIGRTKSEIKDENEYITAIEKCLDGFIGIEPEYYSTAKYHDNDPYTYSDDLFYSGYFEDSINLLAMMALAGDWWVPHGWENDFKKANFEDSDSLDYWDVKTKNGVVAEATIVDKYGSKVLKIKVKDVPNKTTAFDLSLVQSGIILRDQSGYGFSMNVGRSGFSKSCNVDIELKSEESNISSKLSDGEKGLNINQESNTYYSGHIPAMKEGKWPGNKVKTTISIGLGHELEEGIYYIDNLGIFDPERSIKNKYLYIGPWEPDANPADDRHNGYYKGDVVRYIRKTYVCIKDHEIATNVNKPGNTEYWKETTTANIGPEWAQGETYLKETIVNWQGIAYICKVTHSNSFYDPFTDKTNWMIYHDPFVGMAPRWGTGIQYKVGDLVTYNGHIYRCITQHQALISWNPGITYTLWEKDLSPFRPDPVPDSWEVNVAYQIGDIILYKGKKYTCIIAHTAYPGWEPDHTAALWQ